MCPTCPCLYLHRMHTRRKFGTAAAVRQLVKNRQAPDGADFVVMSEISRNVNLAEIKAPAGAS